MTQGAEHHCAYCDVDFGLADFVVITAPSSGMPTLVFRDPSPDEDTRVKGVQYLAQVCRRLFGENCFVDEEIRFRLGSRNDAPTKDHYHVHVERKAVSGPASDRRGDGSEPRSGESLAHDGPGAASDTERKDKSDA